MIPLPNGSRVWIAAGHSDMRRGMHSLALQVQEALKRDPHAGDLYVFRGRSGSLIKILWHDGIGMSLYASALALPKARFGSGAVLCQEGARAPCCTRDEGGPFGAVL